MVSGWDVGKQASDSWSNELQWGSVEVELTPIYVYAALKVGDGAVNCETPEGFCCNVRGEALRGEALFVWER